MGKMNILNTNFVSASLRLLVITLLASTMSIGAASAVPSQIIPGELDRKIPQLMSKAGIPGMSVVVIKDFEVSYAGHFGIKDERTGEPVAANTTFFAASLSKPMFAYAVMRLADRGDIDLDEPLHNYLPHEQLGNDPNARMITARMVLSHTSGLPNWSAGQPLQLKFQPGSSWEYSGEGFVYLQKVVEHITRLDLNAFMKREVFDPLKMRNSSFYITDALENQMATGHDLLGHATKKMRPTKNEMNPAGTLITSALDYSRFMAGYLKGVGLSAKSRGSISTAQHKATGYYGGENELPVYWGLGLGIEAMDTSSNVWQWGDNKDYRNFMMANPGTGNGIVLFSNSTNGLAVAEELTGFVLKEDHIAFDWLPYSDYGDPRFKSRMEIGRSLVDNNGRDARKLYSDLARRSKPETVIEVVVSLGMILSSSGYVKEATQLLTMHAENNSSDYRALDLLANYHLTMGNSGDALTYLRQSAALDPDNLERNSLIARISRQI